MTTVAQVAKYINEQTAKNHLFNYGTNFDSRLLQEEAAELIQAINKVHRYPNDEQIKKNLAEETCDVLLIVNELLISGFIDGCEVAKQIEGKQLRQNRLMEQEGKKLIF